MITRCVVVVVVVVVVVDIGISFHFFSAAGRGFPMRWREKRRSSTHSYVEINTVP
jgi:hypothetical protein